MAFDPKMYIHDSDRVALEALQAIPVFTTVLKSFMKVWNEQQFRIQNMSTNLRLSPTQLPQYYNMLPPICEKLGIEVPELYLSLDVRPNAYTSGDTKPFIVITSGLLETIPVELLPTVLAHECGHIACRHVLYRTMGQMILNGTIASLGLSSLMTLPLEVAFFHWMRCSEYSADRAAVLCDGGSDQLVEVCLRFAGFDKDIQGTVNVAEFLQQADEYAEMVKGNAWNKTLEFMMFKNNSHPLNAVRASEAVKWAKGEQYLRAARYEQQRLGGFHTIDTSRVQADAPIPFGAKGYFGLHYKYMEERLREAGFRNVDLRATSDRRFFAKAGRVVDFSVNGQKSFSEGTWFPIDSFIRITYYEPYENKFEI